VEAMEKQEFCMEKSQIFQEMISRISKLSQDSYLMVTDMQHNLTFVPESTAEFLGIPSGWCEDGYKIVLEKSVHPYDCPEYTEEMKKRLRGINLENDLYIRMGKDKKYVMTQIITDMIISGLAASADSVSSVEDLSSAKEISLIRSQLISSL
jgi:hypothetical protein